MGLGTYGRSFTLASTTNNGLGANAVGGGAQGQYTGETGYIGYYEICQKISQGKHDKKLFFQSCFSIFPVLQKRFCPNLDLGRRVQLFRL